MFLFDPVCAYTVDYGAINPVLFTCAYLSYDFVLYYFWVEDTENPMYWQSLGHHLVGFIGLWAAISTGYSYTGIANLALLCEISTFFLNYRSMFTKE
jgi:hypothetical protein